MLLEGEWDNVRLGTLWVHFEHCFRVHFEHFERIEHFEHIFCCSVDVYSADQWVEILTLGFKDSRDNHYISPIRETLSRKHL